VAAAVVRHREVGRDGVIENRSWDRHQCVLAEQLACVRVQQQSAKETKVIAALKQHYERYHAEDLAALKELYEYHAENCVRAAELTVDPRRREGYLKQAREWTEAATTLQALMAKRSNQAKPADDAPSLTSRPDEWPLAIHASGAGSMQSAQERA
jgi:hypothetical protein